MTTGLLAGVRVVDLSTVGPASRCAAMLADLGAEVVKVLPPPSSGRIQPHFHAYSAGRGTRRIAVDLKDDRARDALLAIIARADVLLDGMRPGALARLGLGEADVRKVNEQIVYASLTGYGQDGPYAQWAGHDINYQAVSGALATAGRRADGRPAIPGATFADSAGGGMHAALAIAAALFRRSQTGEGSFLDVSATDGMLSLTSLMLDRHAATGESEGPGDNVLSGANACYDIYTCADGRFVSVGAIEGKFFANLLEGLGLDRALARGQYDPAQQDDLRERIAAAFATRTRDEWVDLLGPADTCVAPVLDIDEVLDNAQMQARGNVTTAASGTQEFRQTARVLAGSVRPEGGETVPGAGDTDAVELLADAGLDADAITDLLDQGVIA